MSSHLSLNSWRPPQQPLVHNRGTCVPLVRSHCERVVVLSVEGTQVLQTRGLKAQLSLVSALWALSSPLTAARCLS